MYTVTVNNGFEKYFTHQTERLADAALLKRAWEKNVPYLKGSVVVFDKYDYLVPSTELAVGLAIKKNELLSDLAYLQE